MPPSISIWVWEKVQVRQLRRTALGVIPIGEPLGQQDNRTAATLSLLRGLHLERELRLLSLLRRREAASMLTRSVIEASLIGLYLAHVADDDDDRLARESVEHLDRLGMAFWASDEEPAWWSVKGLFDAPLPPRLPDLRQMAEAIDRSVDLGRHFSRPTAQHLYWQWFVPLSNGAVHTTILSVSRQYKFGSRKVRTKPWGILPRRGAIRTADGSLALLAASLQTNESDAAWLRRYADRQLESANLPFIVVSFQAWRSIRLRRIPGMLLAARRLGKPQEATGAVDSEALRTFVGAFGAPADIQEFIEGAIRGGLEDDEHTPPP